MPEHINFDLVEKLKNMEEEVQLKADKGTKISQYFQGIYATSKEMEEYICMVRDEP